MNKQYANVVCAGMDVHRKFTNVTLRDAQENVVARQKIKHGDRKNLRWWFSRWPTGIDVVLEASFGWAWLSDLLQDVGLRPRLSNCFKVEKMREARGWVKTNKKDADLVSLMPFEREDWWEVWLAPPEVRDQREWMRYRSDLVAAQTGTKNRIHSVFHRHGIFHDYSDLFGGRGRRFLCELCRDGGKLLIKEGLLSREELLRGGTLAALRGYVRLLNHLRDQLAHVARKLRKEIKADDLIRRLMTIPGIGLIMAAILRAEIGRIERFKNHNKLAAYSLVAPRAKDSGESDESKAPVGRHLGQRGNRTLKWVFIEAAHAAVKHGGRFGEMFDRCTDGGKKDRSRGYIKVARKLAQIVYVVWKKGVDYTETPPPRSGSKTSKKMDKKKRRKKSHLVRERASSLPL